MRLDLVTERSQTAEVRWTEQTKYGCGGVTIMGGAPYTIKLTKTRFGGGINIYPGRKLTAEEFDGAPTIGKAIPLPDALLPFVGSTFSVDGAPGGILKNQTQGIELLDEIPEGAENKMAFREGLHRSLERDETIGIFGALGFQWAPRDFDDWADEQRRAQMERDARAEMERNAQSQG